MPRIRVQVNGVTREAEVEGRLLLADWLREDLGLTGTKVACAAGACGSCTVHVDGRAVRSCLTLAAQVDGSSVRTIEGVSPPGEPLHPLQQALWDLHGLQCGFCTPGFVMTALPVVESGQPLDRAAARAAIGGNLCRCTGYESIVDAVLAAAERFRERGEGKDR